MFENTTQITTIRSAMVFFSNDDSLHSWMVLQALWMIWFGLCFVLHR